MKKSTKITVVFLLFFCGCINSSAQNIIGDTLSFVGFQNDDLNDPNNGHKGETEFTLPLVVFHNDLAELTFESNENLLLPYYIKDENGIICLEGNIVLLVNRQKVLFIPSLTTGSYSLYIEIGNNIFFAPFNLISIE